MEERVGGGRELSESLRDNVHGPPAASGRELSESLRDNVQSGEEVSESVRALTRPPDPSRIHGNQEHFEREQREKVLAGLEENVLLGVTRRYRLPEGVHPPMRPPRLINVTIRVDDTSLAYARGRAVTEGTSVSALVNRLLEEYSGVARPPGQEISRRIPMFRERRIKPIPGVDDL
jgi:hypothetical protein